MCHNKIDSKTYFMASIGQVSIALKKLRSCFTCCKYLRSRSFWGTVETMSPDELMCGICWSGWIDGRGRRYESSPGRMSACSTGAGWHNHGAVMERDRSIGRPENTIIYS